MAKKIILIIVGILIIGVGVVAFLFYQRSTDPLFIAMDNIITSLEQKDKNKFNQNVDIEKFATNISTDAAVSTLKSSTIKDSEKTQLNEFFGNSVVNTNKIRFIQEIDKFFKGEANAAIGPFKFILANGKNNRTSFIEGEKATIKYTPPSGVNDTTKIFYFEKFNNQWMLVNASQ